MPYRRPLHSYFHTSTRTTSRASRKAERWNGQQWHEIATIAYGMTLGVKEPSQHRSDAHNEAALKPDFDALIEQVKLVLF